MTSSSSSVSNRTMAMDHDAFLEKSPKKFQSTNSWLENKKLQNALDESRALLEEERVEKLGLLSQAEWIPAIQLAKVIKQVGKHWMTMGHSFKGDIVLYPEEALFLLETNAIEINYGGMPMSLQQAYSVLLGPDSDCTLDEYRVYSHLTRYGYRVQRHNAHIQARSRQEDPLEVDVVGIIRKRKSSGNVKPEKDIEIEDSIEVLEQEKKDNPAKRPFSDNEEHQPSTSGNKTTIQVPPSDDDDIKFIEVVDSSKKRKLTGTIIINDDLEITCYSDESAKKINFPGKDKTASRTPTNENFKKENRNNEICGLPPSNAKSAISDSLNMPSRGMYDNKPLASLSGDTELPENSPLSNGRSKRRESSAWEENALKDQKSAANKSETVNDDIIVLSDDETKEDDKNSKELLRFYKEISLIELIDISEDDEGEKAASCATVNGKDRTVDETYDFWGALGRVPTLENGRLMITIPSPPSNLIPRNIHPVKDEYKIDLMTSVEGQNEEGSESDRHVLETQRQMHENNNFSQQCQQQQSQCHLQQTHQQYQQQQQLHHLQRQQYQQQQQRLFHPQNNPPFSRTQTASTSMQNMWNPWNAWNSWQSRFRNYHHSMGNGYQIDSFQGNPNQTNTGRSPWVSLVYSQRPNNYSITTEFQAWFPSNNSSHFQSAHHMSYAQHTSHFNLSDHENRQQPWKRYSNFTNGQNNSMQWQRACSPRRGNGFPRRGSIRGYHRRRFYGRTSRCASNEMYHSVVPKIPDARTWSEVKKSGEKPEKSVESSENFQSETKKDILPLLKPADSISIDAVNAKLQITNSAKFNCYDGSERNQESFSVKFDMYMPNSNFRKSCPGIPKYRLCVVKSDDSIPKLEDNLYLMKNLNDEVPLLYAVSFPDTINFFSFSNVELPVQLSKSS